MIKKILVIKLWAIGEVALSTPCIYRLKTELPDSELHYLVGNNAKDIIMGNPGIKKVFSVDENIFLKPDLIKLILLIRDLKKERFDSIIILHYSAFFSLFAFLIGAPKRLGLQRPGSWSLNTANIKSDGISNSRIRDYFKVSNLLSSSIRNDDGKIMIYPNDEDKRHVVLLMERNNLKTGKFIIFSPTGGENPAASRFNLNIKNKVWPLEYYKKLANLILDKTDFKIVIIGAKAEKERAVFIKGTNYNERITDLTGKTNLRELVLLAAKSAFSITNDSGPMFVISASNTPLIAIFGPTDPFIACPASDNIVIMVEKLNCSPCSYDTTTTDRIKDCKNPICMRNVTPEKVFRKICETLKLDEIKVPTTS